LRRRALGGPILQPAQLSGDGPHRNLFWNGSGTAGILNSMPLSARSPSGETDITLKRSRSVDWWQAVFQPFQPPSEIPPDHRCAPTTGLRLRAAISFRQRTYRDETRVRECPPARVIPAGLLAAAPLANALRFCRCYRRQQTHLKPTQPLLQHAHQSLLSLASRGDASRDRLNDAPHAGCEALLPAILGDLL